MLSRAPIFQLYGEYLTDAEASSIHHEAIKERSEKHGWVIRPHRHEKLIQIFYFQNPGVQIQTLDETFETSGPVIFLAPLMTVHGFKFPEDINGDVISLRKDGKFDQIENQLEAFEPGTAIMFSEKESKYFNSIVEMISQFRQAYDDISHERMELLACITSLILKYIASDTDPSSIKLDSSIDHSQLEQRIQDFCNIVEKDYRQDLKVNDIARELELSAPQLTRITNKMLQCSPKEYIRRRRITEAKRLLLFTRRSMQEIAERSGHHDVGYFSRSFKKMIGQTPSEYRRQFGE